VKAGWEVKALGEFAKTGSGGTPTKGKSEFYHGGTIPWLMSGEVANSNIVKATKFITEQGLAGSSAKIFPENSVLIAMYGATAGQVGILRFEASTNQAVCAVLPCEHHVPEFLYYYLLGTKSVLVSQAVGNAQPNISQAKIKALQIPLPPLDEQKRIVAVLDAAFEGLSRARTHVETNLQNARELFQSEAEHMFSSGLKRWPKLELVDATDIITCGVAKRPDYHATGVPFLSAKNVKKGHIVWGDYKFVSQADHEILTKYNKPRRGDVLYTRVGNF